MARNKVLEKAQAESEDIKVDALPEEEKETIKIQLFTQGYNTQYGGVLKKGTVLEIPEEQFSRWENTAVELED